MNNTHETTEENLVTFETFGLRRELMQSINYAGFTTPSPIQQMVIPVIMEGRDVVGQAHTGTGKTAAFGLPTLNKMNLKGGIETLIITPTRELANQVSDEIFKFGKHLGVRTVTIYGGSSYNRQIDLIERGAQVIIATPGRLLDMLSRDMLKGFAPSTVILDEADEMLDMGFLDDINEIFTYLPSERQTLLFSATMPTPIKQLAERILVNPYFASITKTETTNTDITQQYYVIEESERDDAIIRLMDAEDAQKTVVFCRTKKEVDRLSNVLSAAGYSAKGLHGDMEQRQRESVIKGLKSDAIDVLIATDVAARGLHIDGVTHVFNYHIPFDPESYVHRIGRTGRAGKKGMAITLVTPLEFKELQRIRSKVGTTMEHAYIPSKVDVKEAQVSRLVNEIEKQHIYDEAHKVLDLLKQDYDQEQIAYKLISVLMERNTVQGPNNIGIAAERLEKILHNLERRGNERGGNGRRPGGFNRNRSGGNRNGNGGGGYRGNSDRNSGGERSGGERSGNDRGERSRSFSGQNRSPKPRY
ncbi:MAG: DEAD/DEAH box helicase [Sulfuricurvum sp. PD_MW2]|jgi:ATP-dependent RNA helicase DeaD|uniref:DEAD/DEAH box helicase n=1 Tax=Sulfuricurvum sp. PD_MW2 TaxID=2027917 RepID=UPI000C065421|nr:DEAD/DEAH box helicase [Sulfuricurvum sp. PD_MW2]PHM17670.1 MAG: DEAD/DEAH box helicase [Sulfuricurvum sp. PD_MW2]